MNLAPKLRLENPADFGHVGLLVGGESAEREVSLKGGADIGRSFDGQEIEAFARIVPGADVVILDDVGHYPQLEAPDRVADAALDFFRSCT